MNRLFEFIEPGLCHFREAPVLGKQDVGISTGGPMDRLSSMTGNILLGQEDFCETLEILLPPRIRCLETFHFVLTGAHRECLLKRGSETRSVPHGEVTLARRGAEIWFSPSCRGFRTYLAYRKYSSWAEPSPLGRKRGPFESHFSFYPRGRTLRMLPGPEHRLLEDQDLFFHTTWRISSDSDDMGYRLDGPELRRSGNGSMISDAVSDGTVQLTPGGPIVLLYHRQTVGGYPRIFNLISCDVDFLAQFSPGERVRFQLVTHDEALALNRLKAEEIGLFRTDYPLLKKNPVSI